MLGIPPKRCDRAVVCFLTAAEIDALLAAPDRSTWLGRRDHALLLLACQTGLRVSELTGLTRDDVHLGAGAHVRCHGKGRKDRATPLTQQTVAVLRVWLAERGGRDQRPTVPHPSGPPAVPRRRREAGRQTRHHAAASCPTIAAKNVTPHTLRHSAAMALLHAGVDTSVIALWIGHEDPGSTQAYLHADMTIKETSPRPRPTPDTSPGRYRRTRHPARVPRQPLTPAKPPDYADHLDRVNPR